MRRKQLLAVLLMMVTLFQGLSGTAWAVTARELENKLLCTCGCSDPSLAACDCQVGDGMKEVLKTQVDAGKSEAEIIAFMKKQYGNNVTNAPDKSGFDLTAWITPFAVIFFGAVGVVKVMSTWVARNKANEDDDDPDDGVDPEDGSRPDSSYDDRIKEELKDFGW